MAIYHRKLLHSQDSDQNSTCYDCGPTCPHNCSYPEIYWQPLPPPLPPHSVTSTVTATTHISPYVIIILALLGSAFLFIIYYLIMVRCCTRLRRPPPTQLSDQEDEFHDEDHGFEVDHPIWYITTIGLQSSVINSISVVKYKKDDNFIDGTDCSVCLSEFQDDESLRLLPKCNHAFHIHCIDTWLRSHTNCPLCRAGILSNSFRAVLSPGDRSFSHVAAGSNRHTQIENLDNDGQLGGTNVPESEILDEIEDSKTEYESITAERRSISMDSVAGAGIILTEFEGDSGNSTVNCMNSDRGGDSRT